MAKLPRPRITTKERIEEADLPERVLVALREIASQAKEGLLALSVGVGLQVVSEIFEEEVTSVVGEKGRHDPERVANRHGHEPRSVVLGGRLVKVDRPRVRSAEGAEVDLRTYRVFADRDLLTEAALGRVLAGLSSRRYREGLNLRDLARGIYPPLLADQGLVAALESQARKSPVPVTVESGGVGRHSQDVEAAVYFCCLEALQNVAKYSGATTAAIRLTDGAGTLTFEVSDDGRGFDPGSTGYGTGLQGMADRIDALGGSLEVRSAPEHGTVVVGRVQGVQAAQ